MIDCRGRLGLLLQALLIVFFLAGDSLVILGFVLDPAPSSTLSLLFVFIGTLTAFSAAIGCCTTNGNKCCLRGFLTLSIIALLLQGVGLLGLFISSQDVINDLTSSENEEGKAKDLLEHSKWIYVVVFIIECLAFLTVIFLRRCCETELEFEPFEETMNSRRFKLTELRNSIMKSSLEIDSGISSKRLSEKMAKKYGDLSHTMDWEDPKRWWQFR